LTRWAHGQPEAQAPRSRISQCCSAHLGNPRLALFYSYIAIVLLTLCPLAILSSSKVQAHLHCLCLFLNLLKRPRVYQILALSAAHKRHSWRESRCATSFFDLFLMTHPDDGLCALLPRISVMLELDLLSIVERNTGLTTFLGRNQYLSQSRV